jgi:exodeoxyribonuclease VII small subunit
VTPGASPPADRPEFGAQLARLEEIVRRLEVEDVDLDEALRLFEEGVERLRDARERLAQAEIQVKKVLADRAGKLRVDDLDS